MFEEQLIQNIISKYSKNEYRKEKKKYYQDNKSKLINYNQERISDKYNSDDYFKAQRNAQRFFQMCCKNHDITYSEKMEKHLGYGLDKFRSHLEKQFAKDMSWDNYGNVWDLDHIKPQALFKYKSWEDDDFKKCWGLKNLRPLGKKENLQRDKERK